MNKKLETLKIVQVKEKEKKQVSLS
jgi:hypothetical protein